MNTNDDTNARAEAREEVIELGVASVETHGTPKSQGEFIGHDLALGIASEETQGVPVGADEFLGMNADNGLSNG
jgi:hypothetical protein